MALNRHGRAGKVLQIEVATIFFIALLAALSAAALGAAGSKSRSFAGGRPSVYLLNRAGEAAAIWKSFGLKGAVLVHFGDSIATRKMTERELMPLLKGSGAGYDQLLASARSVLNDNNYIYFASRINQVRRVFGVIPDDKWSAVRRKAGRASVFSVGGENISGWIDGLPLVSGPLKNLPQIDEPVVLDFGADFFKDQTIEPWRVRTALRRAGLRYHIVTITPPRKDDPEYEKTMAKIEAFRSYLKQ